MSQETIVSRGDWYEARILTVVQTMKIFVEKLETSPDSTIDMGLYVRDVGLLLTLLNNAGEKLHGLRTNKRIIT